MPISNSLSAIKNIQGVSYDWKYKSGRRQLGVIAQQVEALIPEVVSEHKLPLSGAPDGIYKTVNYSLIVPHLIESIKELNARIKSLEAKLEK